jgi:hypothetical protein
MSKKDSRTEITVVVVPLNDVISSLLFVNMYARSAISRIFLKCGYFSYDGVSDQHIFTKQRFIANCCNFILPPEAASCLTVPDI